MTDIMRGDVMRDGEVIAHDVVVNTRTGEVVTVTAVPGEVIEFEGDIRDLRFGPGMPIVIQESTVKRILNVVGSDVQFGLTWDWPSPYNGEQRRALRRIKAYLRGAA